MTPDRYQASAGSRDPQSWNRYAYTRGDPVNRIDQGGTCDQSADTDFSVTVCGGDDENSDINYEPQRTTSPNSSGGNSKTIKVTQLQKSGDKYEKVADTFQKILDSIDPDCLAYLDSGGGQTVQSYVSDLLAYDLLAVGLFSKNMYAAFTGSGGTSLDPGDAAMVVNTQGAFFRSNGYVDNGKIQGGSTKADVFILLHELGHALSAQGFQDDGPGAKNANAGKENDQLIDTKCQKTLSKF